MTASAEDLTRKQSHRRLYSSNDPSQSGDGLPEVTYAPLMSIAKRPGLAADAAAQQAFHEKTWFWVPDATKGYVSSWVMKEEGEMAECMGVDDKIRNVDKNELSKQNPPKFDQVEDMAELTHLNEASVVYNLETRYKNDRIYTYSGPFLVAVNPYRNLDGYYSTAAIDQYMNRRREENPPHIFAVAQQAWANMVSEREGQSILITGESGAGKTENTKKVIQFLTAIAADASSTLPPSGSADSVDPAVLMSPSLNRQNSFQHNSYFSQGKKLGQLERQILQANPILEAFGNAQTVRNNNSSRFGKFVRIEFNSSGAIAGAFIDWYLLEKSRVTSRSPQERSFHVFYQLLRGADPRLRQDLHLQGDVADYAYLSASRTDVDEIDDRQEWKHLVSALHIVGFTPAEQLNIFRSVAAILHLGNVEVSGKDRALIEDPAQIEVVAHLLNLSPKAFSSALTQPRVKAGREWVTQARTRQQVIDEIASVCKTLYEKTFGAIVERINKALERPTAKSTFIGVLDIAGFEIFERNSFEQLCINYTNEKLQQFFNHHMFVLEQEEYEREEIGWKFENFGMDLQPTIELIESAQPVGILACLDEECIMPKASDETFTDKLRQLYYAPDNARPDNPATKFSTNRFDKLSFTVQHYAGKVEYHTDNWLDKNKDPLNENLTSVLAASADAFVGALFADFADTTSSTTRSAVKRGAFRTVGQRHKEQLHSLMTQLRSTSPHFVRCIVPNPNKRPSIINTPLVLEQLRCNGVLEGIRIARLGYPNRLPFIEFRHRYEVLTPGVIPKGYMDGRKACQGMLAHLQLDPSDFKVGRSKAFFKAGVLADLEERRDELLYGIFSRIQAACRRFTARRGLMKVLNRAMAARTIQRNARIYLALRQWPWWPLYTKVRPLLAASRSDDELRRKEAELALAKEREQRDIQEKERLAQLQIKADADRKRIEEALEAERLLALEKDESLKRAMQRAKILEDNIESAEHDIDKLLEDREESQRRYDNLHKKFTSLKENFETAAHHLERLEKEQNDWKSQETTLMNVSKQSSAERDDIVRERDSLKSECNKLQRQVDAASEDVKRTEARLNSTIQSLQQKVEAGQAERQSLASKVSESERNCQQARAQLGNLSQASTDYEVILKKKESELQRISGQVATFESIKRKQDTELEQLKSRVFSLQKDAEGSKQQSNISVQAREKAEKDLSQLQALLATKVSEDEQKSESAKQMSSQLAELRQQVSSLQSELAKSERSASASLNSLQVELVSAQKSRDEAVAYKTEREGELSSAQARLKDLERSFAMAEKARIAAQSELQTARSDQLAADEALRKLRQDFADKERELSALSVKYHGHEESMLRSEREQATLQQQVSQLKKLLDTEMQTRSELESSSRQYESKVQDLQQRLTKQERFCVDLQTEIENKEVALNKSKALENKTIVEHVHTLEKAMKVQDRQLAEAQTRYASAQQLIHTLEKAKARLTGELEDLSRSTQKDVSSQRNVDTKMASLQQAATKASESLNRERQAREMADKASDKFRSELREKQSQLESTKRELAQVEKVKAGLQKELASLARSTSPPPMQTYGNIGKSQSNGNRQLLDELARGTSEMSDQMEARLNSLKSSSENRTFGNASPSRPSHAGKNGIGRHMSVDLDMNARQQSRGAQAADLQMLELERMASERVRKHLETQVQQMAAIIQQSSRPGFSNADAQRKLDRETATLQDLLRQEAAARKEAEAARLQGSEALQAHHLKVKSSLDDRFLELEDSRKALQGLQRQTKQENDNLHAALQDASRMKQEMGSELNELKSQVRSLIMQRERDQEVNAQLELHLQELQLDSAATSGYEEQIAAAQQRADSYREQIEAAKVGRRDAERAETSARMGQAEAERIKAEAIAEREAAETRARAAEQYARELDAKYENDTNRYKLQDLERDCRRLQADLESEREQHSRSENEFDERMETLQKAYQAQLEQLTVESDSQRESASRLRDDLRNLKSAHDELQIRYDDEVHSLTAWKYDRDRLEDQLTRSKRAFDDATGRQGELQAQNVELVSQNRDLHLRIDEVEADKAAALQAKKALEQRLQSFSNVQPSSDGARALEMERDDLRKELEASITRLNLAQSRQQGAEAFANEQQRSAAREREDASKVSRENDELQRQLKELKVRLADFEGRTFASSPRPPVSRHADGRVEELTQELNQERRLRTEARETAREREFVIRDLQAKLQEAETIRRRLESDTDGNAGQVLRLKQNLSELRNSESQAQLFASKLQRDVEGSSEREQRLKTELDALRKRLDLSRSPSTMPSLRSQAHLQSQRESSPTPTSPWRRPQ